MNRTINFAKANAPMLIAALAALITAIFVPPDREYLGYFDLKTLSCLFTVLAIVCALGNQRFFYTLAEKIVKRFRNARLAALAIIYITFIGSMLIANDMALLTFLPLGYFVLISSHKEKYMCPLFILQNIAANLGGMLTPFGNPQNLYIYSKFNVDTAKFMLTMLPPFLLSVTLITLVAIILIKPEPLVFSGVERRLPKLRISVYLVIFAFAILCVFKLVPYYYALAVTVPALLIMDRRALLQVDYGLLLTFVFFFIFAGNMSRIPAVRELFSSLLDKSTLVVSALSCQVISNVPTAILLSEFTESWRPLLLGVNIGGVGTLISSLASLITFKEYTLHNPGGSGKYIAVFSVLNFSFLAILLVFSSFFV